MSRYADDFVGFELVDAQGALENAQLCISGAWKLGCVVFFTTHDVMQCRSKAITLLVASIWECSYHVNDSE